MLIHIKTTFLLPIKYLLISDEEIYLDDGSENLNTHGRHFLEDLYKKEENSVTYAKGGVLEDLY
jgi:hypothetical protein